MKPFLLIPINEALYVRNPELTNLGRRIVQHSILLIHEYGFESFNFKKLAEQIETTEAGVYRYFENKHKLLLYLTSWYWGWLQFQLQFHTHNLKTPAAKLNKVILLLTSPVEDDEQTGHVNESILHQIVISEGTKAYLTKQVNEDNRQHFFKPYKELCAMVGEMILECNPRYKYPRSLASTIIEMAHFQHFFMHHLPSLTDFSKRKSDSDVAAFLTELVFTAIGKQPKAV